MLSKIFAIAAALMVVVAVTPAMAGQLFYEDFTDGVLDDAVAGSIYTTNVPVFMTPNQAGVPKIYGVSGDMGSGTEGTWFGWSWDAGGDVPVDMTGASVMFNKVTVVTDYYYATDAVSSSMLAFYLDVEGKNGDGGKVTYFPKCILNNFKTQTMSSVYRWPAPEGDYFVDVIEKNHLMYPEDTAGIKAVLDRVVTNTYVWRDSQDSGTTLTFELDSAVGSAKTTLAGTKNVAMTHFTGLIPTIAQLQPSFPDITPGLVYSTVSGQTDGAAFPPNDASRVKMGWVKFEVGQTHVTDFNFDYNTTLADGQLWASHRGIQDGTATMSQGDATNDGNVTLADGQAWAAARGGSYDTVSGNYEPLVAYDPATGNLTITADEGAINSFIVKVLDSGAYNAADVSMATNNLPVAYGALHWSAGKAIGTDLEYTDPLFLQQGVQVSNLIAANGEVLIALLPTGLGAEDFGQVSLTFGTLGVGIVTTDVTVVPEPGDANNDGYVDDKDASILGANWMQTDAEWADGDFNRDRVVDDADAAILAAHWGNGVNEESVPEPGSLALLFGIAVMGMIYLQPRKA